MGEGDRVCKGGDEPGAGGRESGCGRFAPKEWGVCPGPATALLAVPTEAALLRPDPSPWLDRRCWSYISDGWSLAAHGPQIYEDGTIEWNYSTGGHWPQ